LTGSNLLFPLLTFPYLSRVLGANGLGICNFITSYSQNFIIIAALGLPVYGTREIAKLGDSKLKRSKLFFELITIHLFFTCFLLLIYTASVFMYTKIGDYKSLALLGGTLILFNVFSIEWLFVGLSDFKYITLRSLLIKSLSIISIFLLVKRKEDFTIFFTILVCTTFVTVLVNIFHAKDHLTTKITLTYKGIKVHLKSIFILGVYTVLTSIYSVLPATLLGFLSTKSAVGYYYGANQIIRIVISVFASLITVMIPRMNQIFEQQGKKEYLGLVHKSLHIVISLGIPITFLVFLLADPIVMLLAGKNFINSIVVIQIMAPIILIVAFAQVFVLLILSVNRKDNQMVLLSIIGMAVSLLINLIFIPHFAEKATGFSQLIAEFCVTSVSFFLAKRALAFNFPMKEFLLNLLLAIPFAIITYISFKLFNNNFIIIIISSLLSGGYFIFYQLFLIKDKILIEMALPLYQKLKKDKLINMPKLKRE
jgi:O-antigen/teichoic acid export membrane protein